MVRSLALDAWARRWVAVDKSGRVVADATSTPDLLFVLKRDRIEGVEIMRAPDAHEPAAFGLG